MTNYDYKIIACLIIPLVCVIIVKSFRPQMTENAFFLSIAAIATMLWALQSWQSHKICGRKKTALKAIQRIIFSGIAIMVSLGAGLAVNSLTHNNQRTMWQSTCLGYWVILIIVGICWAHASNKGKNVEQYKIPIMQSILTGLAFGALTCFWAATSI